MLKVLIEQKGHIFETKFNIEASVKKMDVKQNIDRILEAPTITDEQYENLKVKVDFTESEQFTLKKVQMRHELNFKDTIKNEDLNECLKLYDKHKSVIERILEYYKNENFNDNDSYDGKKIDNINDAFEKVLDCLDCEFVDGIKEYDKQDFEDRIDKIVFSKGEINSLASRGKLKKKYDIVKVVLAKFGIGLRVRFVRKRINGKTKQLKSKYELFSQDDIYNTINCILHDNSHKYDKRFFDYVKKHKRYDVLCITKNKKLFK